MTDADALLCRLATDLDRLMSANSLTQADLHRVGGVAEGTVSRVLRARDVRVTTLVRLAAAVGRRVEIVFRD